MSELRQIPNVGAQTEQDLLDMGYPTIASLKGKRAEDLYAEECRLRGCTLDRCQLYLYRAVEYFVNTPHPDLTKCKWWLWKDDFVQPSPCGAVCAECASFPTVCGGCRKIRGKVFPIRTRTYVLSTNAAATGSDGIAAAVPSCLVPAS